MDRLAVFAEGYSFLETPRWHGDRLWAVDMFDHRVVAFTADGSPDASVAVPDVPVGVGWSPDSSLLVLTRGGRLLRQATDRLVQVAGSVGTGPAPCNEITVDAQGTAFVGIFGLTSGALVRADPDGTVQVVADNMLLPNGQALTADGRTLIVAESAGQRLTAFTLEADGSIAERREWARFGEPATATTLPGVLAQVAVWPDGIALDAAGAAWVADPFGRQALRVLEGGEIIDRISTADLGCYACALGGPDGHTLFLCAAESGLDEAGHRARRSARILTHQVGVPAAGHAR